MLADELRRETPLAVQSLRAAGVRRIVMVTGDRAEAAETIGAALDIDAVLADREPADKVEAVVHEQRLHPTLMVGDGINDAPALAAANVGIAPGRPPQRPHGPCLQLSAAENELPQSGLDQSASDPPLKARSHGFANLGWRGKR